MAQPELKIDVIGGLAAKSLAYRTEEALTFYLDQVNGADPVLVKPITKQSEVPAKASKVIGANNAIGIRIVSSPDIELSRNVRPVKSLTGKEITIDGVEYTYAQLESVGILEHPKFGSSLTDGKNNVGRGGQTFRGLASFSAETSKSISLPVAFPDTNYAIKIAPSVATTNLRYANKAVGGFDIVVDANITGEVSWEATKL